MECQKVFFLSWLMDGAKYCSCFFPVKENVELLIKLENTNIGIQG